MNDYVAIVKRTDDDELRHFKYIKREKKNGKWVYYYDQSQLDKYKNNTNESTGPMAVYDKGQGFRDKDYTYKTQYRQSDKLFNTKKTTTMESDKGVTEVTTHYQGKLERGRAAVAKKIHDEVFAKGKVARKATRKAAINKGKQKLNNLLSKKKGR